MTFWSGEKLLKNTSVIDGFDPNRMDTNAFNLRMGDCYFVTGDADDQNDQTKRFLSEGQPFLIPSGQFAYLVTAETVHVPDDAMAFISMRTGIKFKGLINVSGFHVDPGYEGKLVFAAFNASPSPIQICEGDPVFKIWFAGLDVTSSSEHLFEGAGQATIENDLIRGMSKEIYSLQSIAQKFQELENEIERKFATQKPVIDNLTFIWRSLQIGLIIVLFGVLLTLVAPSVLELRNWIKDQLYSEGMNEDTEYTEGTYE